jgi:2-polyprenyl-6-hydroxyphenyl methylase/3-demethylubiquinone-9 3-methyltransferase
MARTRSAPVVNNAIYDALDERWYDAQDDPVALLRAESGCRTPWVEETIRAQFGGKPARVLDIACGAGFLANALASRGHVVTGVDASESSLAVAARHDATGKVRYAVGDALRLPFDDASFDVACAMDFLEHVEDPRTVIAEAARILTPGGLFFFHTFNRNFLAWLVVIKGVEWFVKNTPRDLHVLRLFLKPSEVQAMCAAHGLRVRELRGVRPLLALAPLVRLLVTGRVPEDFRFRFTKSTRISFTGVATKDEPS